MKRWLIVIVGVVAAAGAAAATYAVRDALFVHEALPGTRVLGTDLGGLRESAASARLEGALEPRLAEPIVVAAQGRRVRVRAGDLLRLDAAATAHAALQANRASFWHRAGSLLSPVGWVREVAPVYHVRRRAAAALFTRLDGFGRRSVPASIALKGGKPVVSPARSGTRVNQRAFLDALEQRVATGRGALVVLYRTAVPLVSTAAAEAAAERAGTVLSAPVTLRFRGAAVGSLAPARLAPLLRFEPKGGQLGVTLDERALRKLVQPAVGPWRRRAANARFVVSGKTVRLVPSRLGFDVDPASAVSAVVAAASSPDARIADVPMRDVRADLTTEEADALGIRRQLVSFTTEMGASSSNRIHNVHLMADFIDGTIIRPGQVFSFNDTVGPRTSARGFLEGQMIVGSLVLPAIGGGVCQTATTLFNDAFETGLPILTRVNHNLYLSHYPLGRDATVSWGGPDFRFRNDLKHGILIKTSYTDSTLTFAFYGTPEGRRVVSSTGPKVNWRGPSMNYAVDPSAPYRSVKVVAGTGELGFDVTVKRTVYTRGGKVLRRDTFASHYIPDSPTTVYGPGSHPAGPYIVLPSQT